MRCWHKTVRPRGPAYWLGLLALLCVTSAARPAAAQTSGVVSGVVKDAQGGVLPGVTLSLRNAESIDCRACLPAATT